MKLISICVFLFGGLLASVNSYAESSDLFVLPVKKAFIPQGFDNNDTVQVVLTGKLTGTCEKVAHTQVMTTDDPTKIEIIQWGRRFNGICLPLASTYQSEVTLGRLAAGTYSLSVTGMDPVGLEVSEATVSSQDDYIYAPVAKVTVLREGAQYVATLFGTFPNDCYRWKDIELRDQDDVLVVLPILEYVADRECGNTPVPFEEQIVLPEMSAEYHLLHVRSASGHALNKLFFADGD